MITLKMLVNQEFPGGLVVRIRRFHRGLGSIPGHGNCQQAVQPKLKKKKKVSQPTCLVLTLNLILWSHLIIFRTVDCRVCRHLLQGKELGLHWWSSGWESACQCRGHGFEPWSGRIPHSHNYWSPGALEPTHRNYWSPRSATREATAMRSPLAATRESPQAATKTQHSQKKKEKNRTIF